MTFMSGTRIWLAILIVAPAFAADDARKYPAAPPGVVIERDVAYLPPDRAEKLDLYLPATRPAGTRSPAVVIIHGGGWTGGDKAAEREFNIGTTLAKAGYVCASVEYRKDAGKRWPTNLYDCKTAVRFLRHNAAKYGVDVHHVGVIGGSAGGHLALMVAYTAGMKGLTPDGPYAGESDAVQACVDLYGPADLLTIKDKDGQPRAPVALFAGGRDAAAEMWKLASPVTHVRKDVPPTLILHGTADTTVDLSQSEELAGKLKAAGADHQLMVL